jgi:hypothetical protein
MTRNEVTGVLGGFIGGLSAVVPLDLLREVLLELATRDSYWSEVEKMFNMMGGAELVRGVVAGDESILRPLPDHFVNSPLPPHDR